VLRYAAPAHHRGHDRSARARLPGRGGPRGGHALNDERARLARTLADRGDVLEASRADASADAVAPVLFAAEDAGGAPLAPGVHHLAPRHAGVSLDDPGEVPWRGPNLVHDPCGQWTHR